MTPHRMSRADAEHTMWELVPAPDPNLIERTLESTTQTQQRHSWEFPSRWLPIEQTQRWSSPAPRLVLLVLLAVLALVAALVSTGAPFVRPRDPLSPFGPAANGLITYASAGDIYSVDPVTSEVALLIGGPDRDGSADFSPDGSHLFFAREISGETWLMAATATGGDVHPILDRPAVGVLSGAWSPRGDSIALVSDVNGRPRISIHPIAGTAITTLDLGVDATWPVYRPPAGGEFAFRGVKDGVVDLYLVDPDGGNLRPLGLTSRGLRGQELDLLAPVWSPDGRLLAYHTVDEAEDGTPQTTVHLLDPATGIDRVLDPQPAGINQGWALWSPDGTRLAVQRWEEDGTGRFAIVALDDSARDVEVDLGTPFERGPWIGTWAPDSTRLLEYLDPEVGILSVDPGSGAYTKMPWPAEEPVGWQRTAP